VARIIAAISTAVHIKRPSHACALLFLSLSVLILPAILPAAAETGTGAVSVYFSPDGGIRDKIIAKINLSRKSIKLAIYSFTSGDIAWALERAKERGVEVLMVADRGQSEGKSAERNNFENAVFISDPAIVEKFNKEFDRLSE